MSRVAVRPRTNGGGHVQIRRAARRLPPLGQPRARHHQDESAVRRGTLKERARIARELHDTVAQTFYAITLSALRALTLLNGEQEARVRSIVDDVVQLASGGQTELRALLANLWSDEHLQGQLNGALTRLSEDMQTRHGIHVHLVCRDEPDLPSAVKGGLIRIVQEALRNVAKHAAARRVELVLETTSTELLLAITDDGVGFDPRAPDPGHFGLQSMRERAEGVGGTLDLVSSSGRGTQIRVRIPLEPR